MSTYHHGNLRAALLDRAIEVIGEKGVEGLSLRQLAKDLGVSHAAPTRHFKGRADLHAAIVRDAYDRLTAAVVEDAATADPILRLNLMARGTIRWAMENRARFSVMMNPDVSRFADAELKASLNKFVQLITDAVTDAQQQGFRQEAPTRAILIYGIGAALGVATIVTDDLMGEVLGASDDKRLIDTIANQIIPLQEK